MLQNTKCECGHQNPIGTILCESCGKPLVDDLPADLPLEMRYDGVARRSQKQQPNWLDRVWNFFSSVKVAVILIVITLIGASLGSIFPQEDTLASSVDPSEFYRDQYGTWGAIYHALGLSRTYQSWWFIGLLTMIGASLVICSLDRVLPLYRALSKQQVRKHLQFITRQQVVYIGEVDADPAEWVRQASELLKRKRYRVWTEGDALLAEKNRFSRWGPYINHIGLIVFLLAALIRVMAGWSMDEFVQLDEGETKQIPGTDFYVKNNRFTLEMYSNEEMPKELQGASVVKLYETDATLYKCTANCDDLTKEPVLEQVATHKIRVNSPLSYGGYSIYQNSYLQYAVPKLVSVRPTLVDAKTGKSYGPFDLPMQNPPLTYKVGPYTLKLIDIFPEFGLDDNGQPMSKSRSPNDPAFVFRITGGDLPKEGETYFYFALPKSKGIEKQINEAAAKQHQNSGRFSFEVRMEDTTRSNFMSGLEIRKERGMPFIWVGAGISMVGLMMGFYWQHRRIWLRFDDRRLSLGAYTNKNSYGLRAEVASFLRGMDIDVSPKALDNRRSTR